MPATLFTYLKQVQRFIRDSKQELIDPYDLIEYVNQSRREIAMRAQCIRVLPAISGSVTTATITNGGSLYSDPIAIISPPDSPSGFLPFPNGLQATATVQQIGGVVSNISITGGGSGYFQPQITIFDQNAPGAPLVDNLGHIVRDNLGNIVYASGNNGPAMGMGATATLNTSLNNTLNEGQEVYPFNGVDLQPFPGVASIYFVRSISIIYSNYRYSLPVYSFSVYQAMIRQYVASQYQYVPTFGAQFGQGTSGSLYLYPPPSQTYQLEWDCQCLPQDLIDDQSVEAIPDPWTDAVPYFAAHLAFLELQNGNTARMYHDLFDERMKRFGSYVRPGRVSNPYGRW